MGFGAICSFRHYWWSWTIVSSGKGRLLYLMLCLVAQSCPTLCDTMDSNLPGSSVHGNSPGKNTGVGCHALLQGIFPTQGSNLALPHCRWILYCLSWEKTRNTGMGSVSLLQGIFWTQESNGSILHCRWILY